MQFVKDYIYLWTLTLPQSQGPCPEHLSYKYVYLLHLIFLMQ